MIEQRNAATYPIDDDPLEPFGERLAGDLLVNERSAVFGEGIGELKNRSE
jgi:hypothetical protein